MDGSKASSKRPTAGSRPAIGKPVSLQNAALLETGKEMLAKSGEVGRDICKTMITVCSGAIPIHVALIGLAAGKEFDFNPAQGVLALIGPALYLMAMGVFAYGYFPARASISLDRIQSVSAALNATINRRYNAVRSGMVLLGVGIVFTLAATMYFFSSSSADDTEHQSAAAEVTWLQHLVATSDYRIDRLQADAAGGKRASVHLGVQQEVQEEECRALADLVVANMLEGKRSKLPAVCSDREG